jgi:hypothetical protein
MCKAFLSREELGATWPSDTAESARQELDLDSTIRHPGRRSPSWQAANFSRVRLEMKQKLQFSSPAALADAMVRPAGHARE